MRSDNIAYMPSIDILRGIAALWIVLYHGYQLIGSQLARHYDATTHLNHSINTWLKIGLSQGHTSVALFMTLSGFIFTWGVYGKTVHYLDFIRNRLLRIYPLYVLMLLLGLAAFPTAFSLEGIVCMLLPLADFRDLDLPGLTTMSWAIAVEFQFYLIFPLLISILNRSQQPCSLLLNWIMLTNLVRVFAWLVGGNPDQLVYWHLIGRLDQFFWGMFAAVWLKHHIHREITYRVGLIVGLLLLVSLLYQLDLLAEQPARPFIKMLLPTIEGCIWAMIITCLIGLPSTITTSINRLRAVFVWIGQRSFSVYLLHFPFLIVLRKYHLYIHSISSYVMLDLVINLLLIVLPPLLLFSHLTFTNIERPFLVLRKVYVR